MAGQAGLYQEGAVISDRATAAYMLFSESQSLSAEDDRAVNSAKGVEAQSATEGDITVGSSMVTTVSRGVEWQKHDVGA